MYKAKSKKKFKSFPENFGKFLENFWEIVALFLDPYTRGAFLLGFSWVFTGF